MSKLLILMIPIVLLIGCTGSTKSTDIKAIPDETKRFERRNCNELNKRLDVLTQQEGDLSIEQEDRRVKSRWTFGIAWRDGDVAEQIAAIRGEIIAIKEVLAQKGCKIWNDEKNAQPQVEVLTVKSNAVSEIQTRDKKLIKENLTQEVSKDLVKSTSAQKNNQTIEISKGWVIKSVKKEEIRPIATQTLKLEKESIPLENDSSNKKVTEKAKATSKKQKLFKKESGKKVTTKSVVKKSNKKETDKKETDEKKKNRRELSKKTLPKKDAIQKEDILKSLSKKEPDEKSVTQKIIDKNNEVKKEVNGPKTEKEKSSAILEAFKAKQKSAEIHKESKKEAIFDQTKDVKKESKIKKKTVAKPNFYRGRFGRYN